MEPSLQVMQFVAVVRSSRGVAFQVFQTGDPKRYLFCQCHDLGGGSLVQSGNNIPVYKNDLAQPVRSALANGYGIDMRHYKPPKPPRPHKSGPRKPRTSKPKSDIDITDLGADSF